jgi:tetratricopeptide (TPR) repeat protein
MKASTAARVGSFHWKWIFCCRQMSILGGSFVTRLMTAFIWLLSLPYGAPGEDTVFVQRSASDPVIQRRGTILEWKGNSLILSTPQREREISNDEITEIRTEWPPSYQSALDSVATGNHVQAANQLVQALKDETRPWARRIIRAELVRVLMALNQWETAIEHFLMILVEDPQTRYFYLLPLKWIGTTAISESTATALMKSRDPTEQLIGASWLIPSRQQNDATKVLEQLTHDLNPNVQKLATTQLWRLRGVNLSSVNDRQVEVWEQRIGELPSPLQAGPWYFLAEVQMKRQQFDVAVISWLRIPILHPDQYALAASALYQSSLVLENQQRLNEAESLRSELKQKYGQTIWAQQIPSSSGE